MSEDLSVRMLPWSALQSILDFASGWFCFNRCATASMNIMNKRLPLCLFWVRGLVGSCRFGAVCDGVRRMNQFRIWCLGLHYEFVVVGLTGPTVGLVRP